MKIGVRDLKEIQWHLVRDVLSEQENITMPVC